MRPMEKKIENISKFDSEINLVEFYHQVKSSWKLVVLFSLGFALIGFAYTTQLKTINYSKVLIEIGHKPEAFVPTGNKTLINSPSGVINTLNLEFKHKNPLDFKYIKGLLSYKNVEKKAVEIRYHSQSIETNKKLLKAMSDFITSKHNKIVDDLIKVNLDQIQFKIDLLTTKIEFRENLLKGQKKSVEDRLSDRILNLDRQIAFSSSNGLINTQEIINNLNSKIIIIDILIPGLQTLLTSLEQVILQEEANLKILNSDVNLLSKSNAESPSLNEIIFNYKEKRINTLNEIKLKVNERESIITKIEELKIKDKQNKGIFQLTEEKNRLEEQLLHLNENDKDNSIFQMLQDKAALINDFDSNTNIIKNNFRATNQIGQITNYSKLPSKLAIAFGLLAGFFLSLGIVHIRSRLRLIKES